MHAVIDAVIFEDGLYVGPDTLNSFNHMQERMASHRHLESVETQRQLKAAEQVTGGREALEKYYKSLPVLHKEGK